jgi:protein TonB
MAGHSGGGSWTERRGWLVALCVAAGAHAVVYQQLIQAGPAPVLPGRPPVVTVSLVTTAPAPPVPAPQPVAPPPEPVTTAPPPPPEPKPRARQVKPPPVSPPAARESAPAPPALPQAIASAASTAAGVSAPVEPVLEPPRVDAVYLKNPPPAYPRMLLRRGVEGEVLVRAQVQDDGHCSQVLLKESSGYRLFDEAALSAVRDWRFIPARKGTQTVVAWVDVPIAFRISHSR